MSRPAKPVELVSKNMSQEEIELRTELEKLLKGKSNKVKPFEYLTDKQMAIFNYIVRELKPSGVIGNLDTYILNRCAVAADRIAALDEMANENTELLFDPNYLKARREYTSDFNKCCQELCLSPQSRAKIGIVNKTKKEDAADPLLKLLKKREAR